MEDLQVGVGKVDISPTGRVKREGYLLESYVEGVHDPIYAKALVLKHSDTSVALLCCDLLWLPRELIDPVVCEIETRTGIPREHTMVACSHTHSGPQVTTNAVVARDERYVQALGPKLVEAVVKAEERTTEAKVAVAKGHEDRISYNSRFLLADGTIAWRGLLEGEQATPTGPMDPEVGIVAFATPQGDVLATVYNFACHASSAAYGQVSADYPGAASAVIESRVGGMAFYTRGSSGNIHPLEPAEVMGPKLAEEVVQRMQSPAFASCGALASVKEEAVLPLRALDPEQMKEVDHICDHQTSPEVSEGRKDYFRKCYAAFEALRARTGTISTFIHVIRVGEAVLAGIPGEQFVQSGLEIKARSKFPNTFLVNLANDTIGYIPTRKAYEEGGYQTWIGACSITPEAGEMIVERALDLIEMVV